MLVVFGVALLDGDTTTAAAPPLSPLESRGGLIVAVVVMFGGKDGFCPVRIACINEFAISV